MQDSPGEEQSPPKMDSENVSHSSENGPEEQDLVKHDHTIAERSSENVKGQKEPENKDRLIGTQGAKVNQIGFVDLSDSSLTGQSVENEN